MAAMPNRKRIGFFSRPNVEKLLSYSKPFHAPRLQAILKGKR